MFELKPIERASNLSKHDFQQQFSLPLEPVILEDFTKNWNAIKKWDYQYLKDKGGNVEVPLFAEAFADKGNSYMKAQNNMKFADYLDLLQVSETRLRMFLFNIKKKMPALCEDFDYPDITDRFVKGFPFLFFGQAGSHVDVHYDADLSHVFITQFLGKKRIILFAPEYSNHLYRHPFTVSCNIDLSQPDLEKYPLLKNAKGYECILNPGETLFMPSGYWHYIDYIDTGFSLSLRAQPEQLLLRLKGYKNIFNLMIIDNMLNKILKPARWYSYKEQLAVRRAENHAN